MASSETDIVNDALSVLGETALFSLTDDTDVARICHGIYPNARDFVLAQHPWNRCVKFAALSRTAASPLMKYDYQFLYPSDCLRILEPDEEDAPCRVRWEIGAAASGEAVVWSNSDSLIVRYIFRNKIVELYSPGLVQALSAYLAMKISLAITAHRGKFADMQTLYLTTLSQAKMLDGQEQSATLLEAREITDVRLGG